MSTKNIYFAHAGHTHPEVHVGHEASANSSINATTVVVVVLAVVAVAIIAFVVFDVMKKRTAAKKTK